MSYYQIVRGHANRRSPEDTKKRAEDTSMRARVSSDMGGGAAYTIDEIYWALKRIHLDHYAGQVDGYSKKHNIGQTSAQLGIRDKGKFVAGRWISQNQLVQIIKGLNIPITQNQLEGHLQT